MLTSVPSTPYATAVLGRLTRMYEAARDPVRAGPMAAYMRHQFALLGIGAPEQRALTRGVLDGEYASVAPDTVRAFVVEHATDLSGLSRREALKNL